MKRTLRVGKLFALTALAILAAGCGKPAPLEELRCPCLGDAGFTCCEGRCIRTGQVCPSPSTPLPDAAPGSSTEKDASRDSLVADAPERTPDAPERTPDAPERTPDAPGPAPDAPASSDSNPPPDAMPCGDPGERCCAVNVCRQGGCCTGGVCTGAFELCPQETASCVSSSCGSICGGLRERCCGDAGYCVFEWTTCVRGANQSRCETCGSNGTPCCGRECMPGLVCTRQDGGTDRCMQAFSGAH